MTNKRERPNEDTVAVVAEEEEMTLPTGEAYDNTVEQEQPLEKEPTTTISNVSQTVEQPEPQAAEQEHNQEEKASEEQEQAPNDDDDDELLNMDNNNKRKPSTLPPPAKKQKLVHDGSVDNNDNDNDNDNEDVVDTTPQLLLSPIQPIVTISGGEQQEGEEEQHQDVKRKEHEVQEIAPPFTPPPRKKTKNQSPRQQQPQQRKSPLPHNKNKNKNEDDNNKQMEKAQQEQEQEQVLQQQKRELEQQQVLLNTLQLEKQELEELEQELKQSNQMLQAENEKLQSKLKALDTVIQEQEQSAKQSHSKLLSKQQQLAEQVNVLTDKLERAQKSIQDADELENDTIIRLKQKLAKLEMEKCDSERLAALEKRENASLQRLQLETKVLNEKRKQLQVDLNNKSAECEEVSDLHSLLESLSGITAKLVPSDSNTIKYECTCKSRTHVLMFTLEATSEGHAEYRPISFVRVEMESKAHNSKYWCWDQLQDKRFARKMRVNGELFPLFSARLVSVVWFDDVGIDFTV